MTRQEQLQALADRITEEFTAELHRTAPNSDLDVAPYATATVLPGRKYDKIDLGLDCHRSGRYMVDQDGNIFGIKAYGAINKYLRFGTLDTIDQWNWSGYYARPRREAVHA